MLPQNLQTQPTPNRPSVLCPPPSVLRPQSSAIRPPCPLCLRGEPLLHTNSDSQISLILKNPHSLPVPPPTHLTAQKCTLTFLLNRHKVNYIGDKYFYKREKVANLLFDLVKYLLTALGATVLFTDKDIPTGIVFISAFLAALVFVLGIFITPRKED